jgi:hypothetical protein
MATQTAEKQYILNRETQKIELHFSKAEYQALTDEQKADLKRSFLFSGRQQAWVSRSKNNHYSAIRTAEKLGFVDGGKVGERLTFAEELERKTEKAEARAERYEQYADNANKRAEGLQGEFNELRKDWSWLTQPNINSSAGRSFTRQREKVMARFEKGFEEYRKSDYFREKAETASMTASQVQLKDKTYLNNRIEECNKNIRAIEKNIVTAEERNNEKWLEDLLERMEYEIDKLAFFHNCMDDLGGVQYNKENVKPGYLVKIRGRWDIVVKANTKTVETKPASVPYTLKYAYADIQDMKIPEGWTEPKNEVENPFIEGDILTETNIGGNRIIAAFQIVKVTAKGVSIQRINIEDNKPIPNSFTEDKQERKKVKKHRDGNFVLDGKWGYLYKYNE